jgi:hypothetical protein
MSPRAPVAVRRALAGLLYEAKSVLARSPAVALPIQRLRGRGHVVDDRTEVVIESFPRCASSFAVNAFRLAQRPHETRFADHTHMPANVIAGVRRGLPTMVLIREPEEAIASYLVHSPEVPAASAVRGFLRFYLPLLHLRTRFVTVDFEEATERFGDAIDRLNARFGTSFARFEHTQEALDAIRREIDDDYRPRVADEEEMERIVARPSARRDALKAAARRRYRAVPARYRRRAAAVYAAMTG